MAYYEIRTKNPHYTNYDAEKRYGSVQFNNGVAHVAEDQMWVTTGPGGPLSTVSTPVWELFRDECGYEVRKLEPTEAPIQEPVTKVTRPDRAHD